jgi:hypothetical protein
MKTLFLPFLATTALVGVASAPLSLGIAAMLVLTGGVGAIILQDYSCRPRLQLRGRRVAAKATFHSRMREQNRLAA